MAALDFRRMPRAPFLLLLATVLALGTGRATAQSGPRDGQRSGLAREALAGQRVAVLSLTLVVRDSLVPASAMPGDRTALTAWADSLLEATLAERAPEVLWVFPPEVRRHARKAAGRLPDGANWGQSVMRSTQLKTVPDPLRGNLRLLMGLADGRFAFLPASLHLSVAPEGGVRARLEAVLTDTRSGAVSWRATNAVATAPDAAAAIRGAIATFLPNADLP